MAREPSDMQLAYLLDQAPPTLEERWRTYLSGNPNAFQQITVSTSAVGLEAPNLAVTATVAIRSADVMGRFDGQPAAAATGMLMLNGTTWLLTGVPTLIAASFIRAGSTDAILAVHFWD